jgi:hypothetical protein
MVRYGKASQRKAKKTMHEYKRGKLKSGGFPTSKRVADVFGRDVASSGVKTCYVVVGDTLNQIAHSVDIALRELHEAFAVATLYNQSQLETPWERTNVNGGAIALGHPYGISGIPQEMSFSATSHRRSAFPASIT